VFTLSPEAALRMTGVEFVRSIVFRCSPMHDHLSARCIPCSG
jgi:hypothetical protein